jgi:acetyltransferase
LQARLARARPAARVASAALGFEPPDEHRAKQLLEALGINAPRRAVCASHEEAHQALNRLAKPVVAKILAPELEHKTEVGGVHLNITDAATLDDALAGLDAIPLSSLRRYLIEEMARPGLELIVAAKRDESFGPLVMVGLGGIYAEALRDTVTRLAPLTQTDAEEMLEQLRLAPLFSAWRGQSKLDRPAVARSLVALGQFVCQEPRIESFEINPLRVYPSGVLALDALLICESR